MMSIFQPIIDGILMPIINALMDVLEPVVKTITNYVFKPFFEPLAWFVSSIVYVFKPILTFIGKILDFLVTIIYFVFSIIDVVVFLPLKFLEIIGLIKPADPKSVLKGISQLSSIMSDTNNGFRQSSANVNVVINKNNFSTLVSGMVIGSILLLVYFGSSISLGSFGSFGSFGSLGNFGSVGSVSKFGSLGSTGSIGSFGSLSKVF